MYENYNRKINKKLLSGQSTGNTKDKTNIFPISRKYIFILTKILLNFWKDKKRADKVNPFSSFSKSIT